MVKIDGGSRVLLDRRCLDVRLLLLIWRHGGRLRGIRAETGHARGVSPQRTRHRLPARPGRGGRVLTIPAGPLCRRQVRGETGKGALRRGEAPPMMMFGRVRPLRGRQLGVLSVLSVLSVLGVLSLGRLHKVLGPVQGRLGQRAPDAHAGKDERYHGRRDAAAERGSQHVHLDSSLLQAQALLPRLLLLLPRLLLLGLGHQPVPHRLLGPLPLLGRRRQAGPRLAVMRSRGDGRGRGLLGGQCHGRRRRQAPVRSRHEQARAARRGLVRRLLAGRGRRRAEGGRRRWQIMNGLVAVGCGRLRQGKHHLIGCYRGHMWSGFGSLWETSAEQEEGDEKWWAREKCNRARRLGSSSSRRRRRTKWMYNGGDASRRACHGTKAKANKLEVTASLRRAAGRGQRQMGTWGQNRASLIGT